MKRGMRIGVIIALFLLSMAAFAFADDGSTITIKGDGVSHEVTYTMPQLQAMSQEIYSAAYSATNNWPNEKTVYAKGVTLDYLLQQAGIKENATLIKVTSSDGYYKTFTREQLLSDDKYSYIGDTKKVKTVIAFQRGESGFSKMSACDPVLIMGQHVKGEQTYPWFVQDTAEIEVTTAAAEQWSGITFSRKVTASGVAVTPVFEPLNAVKIYYTTDGTTPTMNSKVYNISATYYQPQLNVPILVSKNTTIKAIAIGPGKTDSPVASIRIRFDDGSFLDLDGYEWAQAAIEDLAAKKIINGMGNGRFAPEGNLTRAQFAKMVVLALGYEPSTVYQKKFSDVQSGAWYTGYVLKAAELGLINGYTNGTFCPDKTLNKQEMIKIVACAVANNEVIEQADLHVLDPASTTDAWAKKYVAYAEQKGMLEHGHVATVSGNKIMFRGTATALRAEAACVISAMQNAK